MNLAALQRRLNALFWTPALEAWWVRSMRSRLENVPLAQVPKGQTRRLYIDVSVISRHDAGTGIQRVVRAVATHMLQSPPSGWQVVPVAATRKRPYAPVAWPNGAKAEQVSDMAVQSGDVFLGLDFALDTVCQHRRQLQAYKRRGLCIWFVMYDLLPAQRPDWFSDAMVVRFRHWLRVISGLVDGFFCISATVAEDLRHHLKSRFQLGELQLPHITVMPMGWDIQSAPHAEGTTATAQQLLKTLNGQPSALMVGTLEPRKGHADVLAAFDWLWQQGQKIHLVIVGKPGWKTKALQHSIQNHPEQGIHLHWLANATDQDLEQIYQACTGVLAASYAEGYGLPVLEALGYGKPVLARDIAAFHSLRNAAVRYFERQASKLALAEHIQTWMTESHRHPHVPAPMVGLTWAKVSQHMIGVLSGGGSNAHCH